MNHSNPIYRAWDKLPLTAKVLFILGTAFLAGGTTYAAASDFVGLPARVDDLELSDAEQSTMLRFLVCHARSEDPEGCEFILSSYDAEVR